MKLFDKDGKEIVFNEDYLDFRGDTHTIVGAEEPRHSDSTGRVFTYTGASFYPSVFGFKWREEE